jgi:hypothetical protein
VAKLVSRCEEQRAKGNGKRILRVIPVGQKSGDESPHSKTVRAARSMRTGQSALPAQVAALQNCSRCALNADRMSALPAQVAAIQNCSRCALNADGTVRAPSPSRRTPKLFALRAQCGRDSPRSQPKSPHSKTVRAARSMRTGRPRSQPKSPHSKTVRAARSMRTGCPRSQRTRGQ